MRQLNTLVFLFVNIFCIGSVLASHSKGGEITWKCTGQGYVFTVTVYRDCSIIAPYSIDNQYLESDGIPMEIPGFPGNRFPLYLYSKQDITPQCEFKPGGPVQLKNCGLGEISGDFGSVEKLTFKTDTIHMNGVPAPSASGYTFYYSGACCRSVSANTACTDMVLRAKMFPYYPSDESSPLPISECYDNSPYFSESPVTVYLANSREVNQNHLHFDTDCDSLTYTFDYPWGGFNEECSFILPYNVNSPFPGITSSLNAENGSLRFKPSSEGDFHYCIRIDGYKCNQRVASVYKDFIYRVSSSPENYETNNPPEIFPPFAGGTSWDTTIYAHEFVEFTITAQDTDRHVYNLQEPSKIELIVLGDIFGSDYTDPQQGCQNPPCAIVSNSSSSDPSPFYTNNELNGFGYSYTGNGDIKIKWHADCNGKCKSNCPTAGSTYTIIVKARDTDCPVPAQETRLIRIKVLNTKAKFQANAIGLNANFSTDITGASSYFWYFGDGSTSDLQNPAHIYEQPGAYMACLMVWDSCYNNDYACKVLQISNTTGIDASPFRNVVIYPNPASSGLFIEGMNSEAFSLKVCDVLGKSHEIMVASAGERKLMLDTKDLPAGCYYLHLENSRGKIVKPFIRAGQH